MGRGVDMDITPKKTPQVKEEVVVGAAANSQRNRNKKQVTKPENNLENTDSRQSQSDAGSEQNNNNSMNREKKRKNENTTSSQEKIIKTMEKEEIMISTNSDYDSCANEAPMSKSRSPNTKTSQDSPSKDAPLIRKQQTAVSAALAGGVPGSESSSGDTSTQTEVVVECCAPYDGHTWVNVGSERDGMAPDSVQYARALRPPYHLLSFLRMKGHSTKGISCTNKNTLVFVVLEGEFTVILNTTQFTARKGDSFFIPPKNYYNLINMGSREAELSLFQYQYDGPLPTVQPL